MAAPILRKSLLFMGSIFPKKSLFLHLMPFLIQKLKPLKISGSSVDAAMLTYYVRDQFGCRWIQLCLENVWYKFSSFGTEKTAANHKQKHTEVIKNA